MNDLKFLNKELKPKLLALAVSQALIWAPVASLQSATINVDPPGTPGGCDLISAIETANSDNVSLVCTRGNGPDTINLPANAVFSYTTAHSVSSALPTITSTITINGNGSTVRRDTGAFESFRILNTSSATLTLNNLTLLGGRIADSGGGIRSDDSTLTLNNSTVSDNYATVDGGGISILNSTLTLNNSTVSDNYAADDIGGIDSFNSPVVLDGSTVSGNSAGDCCGGMFFYGSSISFSNTTVSGNSAAAGVGGMGFFEATVTLNDSTVSGNIAATNSGGIAADNSVITVNDSTLSGNSASVGDGGGMRAGQNSTINLNNSIVSGNYAFSSGGGIYSITSDLEFNGSTISNNKSRFDGGALFFSGNLRTVNITNSTLAMNSAGVYGGAMVVRNSASTNINASTLSGNIANFAGGAVTLNYSGSAALVNSTFSGNKSYYSGGALWLGTSTSITLNNSTLVENKVITGGVTPPDRGGAMYADGSALITAVNTVIADSSPADCGGKKPGAGVNNWFEDNSCSGTANGDPKLGALEFNGGPTKTRAPLPGSGLEGAGNIFGCLNPPVNNLDQRGETRGNPCFIGAVDDIVDPVVFFTIPLPNGKAVVIAL